MELQTNLAWLVVWNIFYAFPYIGNFIIPTDELIFFRGVAIPPTSPTRIVYLLKLVKSHSSFKLPEVNPRKDQQTLLWKIIINTSTHRDAINKDQTVGNVIFATTGKQKGGFIVTD